MGEGVTSTHNKRGCAILTIKVVPKNPGTYLKRIVFTNEELKDLVVRVVSIQPCHN